MRLRARVLVESDSPPEFQIFYRVRPPFCSEGCGLRAGASKVTCTYNAISDVLNIRVDWATEDAGALPSLVVFFPAGVWAEYPLTTETLTCDNFPGEFPQIPV